MRYLLVVSAAGGASLERTKGCDVWARTVEDISKVSQLDEIDTYAASQTVVRIFESTLCLL